MQQVADWLEKLGLGQYAQRFAENDISMTGGPIAGVNNFPPGRELRKSQVRRTTAPAALRKGHGLDIVR
jgi:SAM domain (Sterile alpha motif)